jgi:hypothetical protein
MTDKPKRLQPAQALAPIPNGDRQFYVIFPNRDALPRKFKAFIE